MSTAIITHGVKTFSFSNFLIAPRGSPRGDTNMAQTIKTPIPDKTAPWGDYDFQRVEEHIKARLEALEAGDTRQLTELLGKKVGDYCFSPSPNASNHYELWGFASAADKAEFLAEYNSGGELDAATAALRIAVSELPIAATAVDTYSLALSTSRAGSTSAAPIVVKRGASFQVPLRVLAWHYPATGTGDAAAYERQPSIVIERSANGTTWTQVGTVGVTGIADSLTDASYPNVVDIGKMIDTGSDGALMVRFSIPTYVYTNAAGEQATMASNRVVLYLRTVTLGISMAVTDWISPIRIGDSATVVPVRFTLQGNVSKTLHVKMTNAAGSETYNVETQNVTAVGEYDYAINDDSGTLGVATSGVHTLTAWVTYGSGADEIISDTIVHQLLVLKPSTADSVGPRVLVQQMAQSVDNFVQSVLCHYYVWNPKLENGIWVNDTSSNVAVRFIVADSPNLAESHTEYVTLPVSVTPGTDCALLATMEIETSVVQDSYTARLHALSSSGTAMLTPSRQFSIDNTAGFQPTAGSVFHLNPKARDNDESNPRTILNARSGNAVIASEWSDTFKMDGSDGWVTDSDGEKALLVPSGRFLAITGINPFNHFFTAPAPSKALTMELDFKVCNVINEDDPVLQLCEPSGTAGEYLGLRLRPMVGTMGCVTETAEATTDFRWAENRRQHLVVTVTPSVAPNVKDDARFTSGYAAAANGVINLVRVYLNGVIVRETRYNPNNPSEFCTGALSNGGIKFGQVGEDGRVSGADIYIYGVRVWESGLAPRQVLQNRISALPGSDEKRRIKAQNDITMDDNSGRISLAKASAIGKNCLIWHGVEPMYGYGADGSERGWWEIRRYDNNGNFLPLFSGSICRASKRLKAKGQGTTAMTYFYWNMQTKFGDIGWNDDDQLVPTECLILLPEQISDIIHLGTPIEREQDDETFALVDATFTHVCPVYGGNLGKDEPVGTAAKNYPCTVDAQGNVETIMLPDGWVNGSGVLFDATTNPTGGLYCGQCWQADAGLPYGSKHVLKINYASSMQSHLIGVNWLYDALHKAYCGPNSLQRDVPNAVVAKQVVPFLFFTAGKDVVDQDETDGSANFRGMGGFGPGKMDKPSWGYSKKASKITDAADAHYRPNGHDYFGMFEGAVNNSILTDFLAPWDDTDHLDAQGNVIQRAKVKYFLQDPTNPGVAKDPESFYYRHTTLKDGVEVDSWEKGIGFDAGKTGRTADDGLLFNSNSCDNPSEAPSAKITGIVRNAWNYVYLHNPNIRYFNGTQDDLAGANLTEAQRKRKYITRDSFLLKRWDFCERRWVDAGLWNTNTHAYNPVNIFEAIGSPSDIADDRQAVVDAYIAHIVAEATPSNAAETDGIGAYFKAKSLRFHYAFENHLIAGTDNCSKNTYYVIDPVTHLIELHQDDVDTTLATDNFGFQSKPYYVDRMNPYDDKDIVRAENQSCYDGMLNMLFDLVEAMWADNGTIAVALGSIFASMCNLTGGLTSAESASQDGVWRALNRYLFDIQRYFPQVCFNEAARIRYEFPAMLGFIGRDGEADPLAQSMGDQLEAEIQFMRRRLIYMASYAGFGEFSSSVGGSSGSIGLDDAAAQLSVNSVALPNGGIPDQTFTVTPHQYLFPVFTWQSQTDATRRRTAPGEAFTYTTNFGFANTYPIALRGLNYYRSVGNLGDKTVNATSFSIQGSRLTEFIAEPTTYYSKTQGGDSISRAAYNALPTGQKDLYAPAFSRPSNLQIGGGVDGATRLRKLSLNGCVDTGSTGRIPFDLSRLSLAEEIDLRGTAMQAVTIPETSTLTSLRLPASLTELTLTAQPNLAALSLEGYSALTQLTVTGSPLLGASLRGHVLSMASVNAGVTRLDLAHLNWTTQQVEANIIRWLISVGDNGVCRLAGKIGVVNGSAGILTYDDTAALITRYGDIRNTENALYINFPGTTIAASSMSIEGKKYINTDTESVAYDLDISDNFSGLGLLVANGNGNDVAVATRADGSTTPDVVWELTDDVDGVYVEFPDPYSPVLHFLQKGSAVERITLNVRATLTNTSGEKREVTKRIGLWNRIPEVGDYAWTDGQFDNQDDPSKQLAGMVIRREEIRNGDDEITAYKLTILSAANTSFQTSLVESGYESSWGPYPAASQGFSDAKTDGAYNDAVMEAIRLATGRSDVFDTPLPNQTGDQYIRKDADAVAAAGGGIAMQDATNVANDGYAVYSQAYMNNFNTEEENDTLLEYADTVLMAVYSAMGISQQDFADIRQEGGCTSAGVPLTTQGMFRIAEMLVQKAADAGITTPSRYRELLFPAVRRCHVWSPADISGTGVAESQLHESYRRGNWMLPSSGLLARIFNFMANSRTSYNVSSAPALEYAEQSEGGQAPNVSLEAQKPLFANAIARGRAIPISSGSYHWSVTEGNRYSARYVYFTNGNAGGYYKYNGYVVRPVAAFTFVP